MAKQTYRQWLVERHLREGYPDKAQQVLEMSDVSLMEIMHKHILDLEARLKHSKDTASRLRFPDMSGG